MIDWESIAESVRVEEVLDELGIRIQQIHKGEHWASCPLPSHPGADASPSWSINAENLVYNCFVCGGGNLPGLVIHMVESVHDWQDALRWLAPFSDVDIDGEDDVAFMKQLQGYLDRAETPSKRQRGTTLPYYSNSVIDRLETAPVALLAKWGIKDQRTVEEFRIKYDEERRRLKGGKEYVGPCIIVPHFWHESLVGYQERWLDDDRPKWVAKYTNSDDFPKKETLFNWDRAVEEARKGLVTVVVESAFTAIRLWELGYSVMATFGASVSDQQVKYLGSLFGGVALSYDSDPDFVNAKGQVVKGAGQKTLKALTVRLSDLIPVSVVPQVGLDKGDLADLEDAQIYDLIARARPSFGV